MWRVRLDTWHWQGKGWNGWEDLYRCSSPRLSIIIPSVALENWNGLLASQLFLPHTRQFPGVVSCAGKIASSRVPTWSRPAHWCDSALRIYFHCYNAAVMKQRMLLVTRNRFRLSVFLNAQTIDSVSFIRTVEPFILQYRSFGAPECFWVVSSRFLSMWSDHSSLSLVKHTWVVLLRWLYSWAVSLTRCCSCDIFLFP